ncbi:MULTISPECIES: transcriptional activator NhaR [unclassified Agarivorans]|uniref:transcriptional activator NhaR n=1 Tax=unclassified Agarivorans TaxID=2636026 RepID=UPI0026E342EA|nr:MULTISPECIES: transcriptional activator NhaR [unclassified Agarivorans]MDO6685207.1 transcriptional activator NhaR [Agarivorans sp. 3_MG-2023]MDO6715621.1 transcriptional activator NhaR [Agarivorans sp. 2_MG-2023]
MINYKHLHYFWVAAKQGGIARASESLHITPQTISGQISLLEQHFGDDLFVKVGRNLELTETGRLALSYADEIFSLGDELEDALRNGPTERPQILKVGIAEVVPKTIAYRLLAPALNLSDDVRMVCKENTLESLLAELALNRLDLVLADGPVPPGLGVRGFNHPLGESGISFLAVPELAKRLTADFPASLDGAPLLIPSEINLMHVRLLQWFDKQNIHPKIVGEFDDSALMKAFGQAGTGVFTVPTAIADEVVNQYKVEVIGCTEAVREQFFAISAERRVSNPAVVAITEQAREWLK